ncbi:MAG: DNA replication/repair protein RecF [Atopobiaceae bacterium]|nr:DNA replication/repair protein RecF [Atopobiaceae bacterium]
MGLTVTCVAMSDWRSFEEHTIELTPGLNVLCGPNATGKTNTVEALQLLTAGTSFRHPRTTELVRDGADEGRAKARLEGDGRVIDVCCRVARGRRRTFERNGKPCRPADLSATLMSVLFCPDDLSLVKGSARARRDALDAFGAQASAGYRKVSKAYARAVEQRNRLLKEAHVDLGMLEAWDGAVALGGATLLHARMALFERLRTQIRRVYERVADEPLECAYDCSIGPDAAGLTRDELRDLILDAIAERRAEELRRGVTLVGPHRDDVSFSIGGRDARSFGSQGQQRSVALAWKMAEVAVARDVVGEQPLLLLDDVMSELDARRRAAVTEFVVGRIQTVITTANLQYFPPELLECAEVIDFGGC